MNSIRFGIALTVVLISGCAATAPRLPEAAPDVPTNGGPPVTAPAPAPRPPGQEMTVPNSEYLTTSPKYQGRPVYRVWYGTNRAPINPADPSKGFGNQRDSKINYGACIVEIPESHEFGSTGSSWIKRWIKRTDDRLKLHEIEPMDRARFVDFMRAKLASRPQGQRTTLIYIHGYNVDFNEAAIRAAQIGFDLKVDGETAFFSWASRGDVKAYVADGATIRASELHLQEFITTILDNPAAERIDILAHSMGNQALLGVMERIRQQKGTAAFNRIANVILAAPDVDIDEFRQLASVYPSVARRTTLYISSKDLALKSSGIVNDHPRAGFTPPVTIVPGIDTVEVSDIDLTVLGHGYFAEAGAVLYDMFDLLKSNRGPEQRVRLAPKRTPDNREYWAIRP